MLAFQLKQPIATISLCPKIVCGQNLHSNNLHIYLVILLRVAEAWSLLQLSLGE